jgi:poly-gamma-glutamate synthesis protein (capsule biosynthesis protein)
MSILCFSFFINTLLSGCTTKEEKLTILFTGDMMLDRGTRKIIEHKGVDYLFEEVKPLFLNQDLVITNFEGTACDKGLTPSSKAFCFRTEPEWITSIKKNGISAVCLSNNHSGDYGKIGLFQTAQYLNHNKIEAFGYNLKGDPCAPFVLEKNDIKLAVFGSSLLYEKDPAGSCHESDSILCRRVSIFKKGHPDFHIVLCLHWGIEMQGQPETKQVQQAHSFIDAGVDLIIGHHPHVVQPIEKYKDRYIFYSLGNFIFDQEKSPGNKGILSSFSVTRSQIRLEEVIPFNIIDSKPILMDLGEAKQFLKPFNHSL